VCGFLLFCTACVRVRSPAAPMMVLYGIFGVSECELTNINDRSCQ
jgi:xanthosine utilization system XapX-like protein